MHSLILIVCLVQVQVQATDWLNRTVRVDLITSRINFHRRYDLFEQSGRMEGTVDATNGQYPWSIMTAAWSFQGGFGIGTTCSATIISNNFAVSNLGCVRLNSRPPVSLIEVSIGSVQWNSTPSPTNSVRHYWYIEPSANDRPNIVLFRLHELLTFDPNIQPIRLPMHGNFAYEDWSSCALGFRTPRAGPFSAQLSFLKTSILNNEQCNFNGNAPDYEICGIEGSDPNPGGPIMRVNAFSGGAWIVYEYIADFQNTPVLIGIHNYQFANQTASFGYGTRVAPFVEWIQTISVE